MWPFNPHLVYKICSKLVPPNVSGMDETFEFSRASPHQMPMLANTSQTWLGLASAGLGLQFVP
jgi:hypothetical protein